ncbi:uncharacterized protein ACN427_002606 isoform 1-T1 [Glossina fuscipes fuscipes]
MQHIDAKHCVLEIDSKEEIFIVNLESDSGVYGNNKRVGPLTKERLQLDEDFGLGEQLKAQIKRRGLRQDIADPSPTIQRLGQSGTYLHEVSANMKASTQTTKQQL